MWKKVIQFSCKIYCFLYLQTSINIFFLVINYIFKRINLINIKIKRVYFNFCQPKSYVSVFWVVVKISEQKSKISLELIICRSNIKMMNWKLLLKSTLKVITMIWSFSQFHLRIWFKIQKIFSQHHIYRSIKEIYHK